MSISSVKQLKNVIRPFRNRVRGMVYYGTTHYCPVCDKSCRQFLVVGRKQKGRKCPTCDSLQRHRFAWLFLGQRKLLNEGMRLLHIAPERFLEPLFRRAVGGGYLSADLFDPSVMVKMDITDIQYDDGHFDAVFCSHVLEHVVEDRLAMGEFYRVLKQGGWAFFQVPIKGDVTHEDFSVTDPQERLRLFGQENHVRWYGRDFAERLRDVGFIVEVVEPKDMFSEDEIFRMGVVEGSGPIYRCQKLVNERLD